jgi:large subunit ribosomal protein L15
MNLHELHPAPGSTKSKKRLGRGIGSGQGKTAGRGHKGQKARNTVRPGFEGGQTPLHRRLPLRRGFRNPFKKEYAIVNLSRLAVFEAGTVVTPELLQERRIVDDIKDGIKVLGDGELAKPITVRAHRFSKSAEEKLKACGGTAEVI